MIKKTLYFGNPAYLSLRNKQLVIKMPAVEKSQNVADIIRAESITTKPIEDLGVVVLDHQQITITQGLLEALLENNVALITCNSRSMPIGLQLPLYGNTIQNERFRSQLDASKPLQKQLWQQTMKAKIENQAYVLKHNTETETQCMFVWADCLKSGDPTNLEARAAVYYWKNLFFKECLTSSANAKECLPTICSTTDMPSCVPSLHAHSFAAACCQLWAYTTTTDIMPTAWQMTLWSHIVPTLTN